MKQQIQKIANYFGYKIIKNPNMTRASTNYVREYLGKDLVVVEIGTYLGDNALNLLANLSIKKLYLIDPYSYDINDKTGLYNVDLKQAEKIAREKLKPFNNVKFIIKPSQDALDCIPDNVDFVYIDGNHDYEYVKKDIELYYPKVKVGGVIGGHNIEVEGVRKAFLEFINKNKKVLYLVGEDWWIVK